MEVGITPATDTVRVLPGAYNLGTDTLNASTLVEGAPGQPIPLIVSNGAGAASGGATAALRRLRIDGTNTGSARVVDLVGAASYGEQLYIVSRGTSNGALQLRDAASLRDSVVWNRGEGATIIIGGTGTATLRGVTRSRRARRSGPRSRCRIRSQCRSRQRWERASTT